MARAYFEILSGSSGIITIASLLGLDTTVFGSTPSARRFNMADFGLLPWELRLLRWDPDDLTGPVPGTVSFFLKDYLNFLKSQFKITML